MCVIKTPIIAALHVTVEDNSVKCGQADAFLCMWKRLEHRWTAGHWTLVRFISAAHEKNAHMPWLCNAHTVLHLCWAILLYIYEYLRANAFKSCILMLWKYFKQTTSEKNLKFEQSLCWKDEVYGYLNFKVIFEGHTVCEVGDHGKQTQVYLQKIRGPEGLLNNANTNWILTSQMSQRRQGSRFFPFREVGEVHSMCHSYI